MTIQAAFAHIIKSIQPLYEEREAANIAHMLLEHITGMGKMDRIVYKDKPLDDTQLAGLQAGIEALLAKRPIQYIIGSSWFYGMELLVNQHVLIPRPETEELVEWILSENTNPQAHILDIGTGSGCIPIALQKQLPQAKVWGIDISEDALAVAQSNATRQQTPVQFAVMSALDTAATAELPPFDIIVSNPPYIRQREKADMQHQVVDYEPSLALFVPDNDPLLFYRYIGTLALQKLPTGGKLYFEINEALGNEVVELLQSQGFTDVTLRADLFGKHRMVSATKG
ncbi:peptide chain release factor N(5)-glutamine methyltransferase [Chitinophaga horti]|uniref:Release factor glutamine methyltransferase n=1 Tax=Chitinophaga horti TaxID=2920382 RepID=A0ABY6J2V4_9BACT|nr:peptide chain release factor N(5)-glutamine methyltransferase [Chitinophaga horti]UYQ93993.1 peptide chain release factor N(5)-glutamine methyltransferase [Chitinophaga horti]